MIQRTFEKWSEGVEFPPHLQDHEKKKYTAALNKDENKGSGGSLFASASNDHGSDSSVHIAADALARFMTLGVIFDASKIIHSLQKFGVTFQSVEEMLERKDSFWLLKSTDMKIANFLLEQSGISPIEWKWVDQGKTVFPWVPVHRCEVPRLEQHQH